ncbi:hypothetical protein ILYODFUR_002500 [Ilyodon furcidens]|uniref:Uncharacterized protein n=1 Tax=Ilyodon furcidens TaxID=33524 RepID=A0ABV0SHU9_9TELE
MAWGQHGREQAHACCQSSLCLRTTSSAVEGYHWGLLPGLVLVPLPSLTAAPLDFNYTELLPLLCTHTPTHTSTHNSLAAGYENVVKYSTSMCVGAIDTFSSLNLVLLLYSYLAFLPFFLIIFVFFVYYCLCG